MLVLEVLGDRIWVEADAVKTETDGGLALAPSAQDRPCLGTVRGVGPEAGPFAVGDRVLYASWAGIEYAADGQKWLILRHADIVGKVSVVAGGPKLVTG